MITLLFDTDEDPFQGETEEYLGPDTTVTWAHLLRESKLPVEDDEPLLVGANNYFSRTRSR